MKRSLNILGSLISSLFILGVVSGCNESMRGKIEAPGNIPVVEKALKDSSSRFYADFKSYPKELKDLPIGVFDSGTGGLTVLEKLVALDKFDNINGAINGDQILDFAGEHFIYLADQANMPYGNYDAAGKSDYLKELVAKDALFLLSDKYFSNQFEEVPTGVKPHVKIIVVACNTATAYGLDIIENLLEQSNTGVKVIGVINAGVKATLDQLNVEKMTSPFSIGVLATPGTIASGAYSRTIGKMLKDRGVKVEVSVVNQKGYGFAESVDGEPEFVSPELTSTRENYRGPRLGNGDDSLDINLMRAYNFDYSGNRMLMQRDAEGRLLDLQLNNAVNYAKFNLVSLIEKHRLSGKQFPLKAVILGCTHYPFLIETLEEELAYLRNYRVDGKYIYRDLIADDFIFIDPALYTAMECYTTLREDGNLALRISEQKVASYISVPDPTLEADYLTPDGKLTYDFKYGRVIGTEDVTTKTVPFSKENIDHNNLLRIEKMLPYSYSLIAPAL